MIVFDLWLSFSSFYSFLQRPYDSVFLSLRAVHMQFWGVAWNWAILILRWASVAHMLELVGILPMCDWTLKIENWWTDGWMVTPYFENAVFQIKYRYFLKVTMEFAADSVLQQAARQSDSVRQRAAESLDVAMSIRVGASIFWPTCRLFTSKLTFFLINELWKLKIGQLKEYVDQNNHFESLLFF